MLIEGLIEKNNKRILQKWSTLNVILWELININYYKLVMQIGTNNMQIKISLYYFYRVSFVCATVPGINHDPAL